MMRNHMRLDATNAQLEELTRGVADGTVAKKQIVSFFGEHVVAEGS